MKLIYISGYGRSGSTLLELVLNKEKNIIGLGEISNFNAAVKQNELCSCKENLKTCKFWSPILKKCDPTKNKISIKKLIKSIFLEHPNTVFIDSSKSTRKGFYRPFIHKKQANVKIIHIIRKSQDCLSSNRKKSNLKSLKGKEEPVRFAFIRTIINWFLANFVLFFYKLFFKSKNVKVISYYDLVNNYETTIGDLNVFLNDYNVSINTNKTFINTSHLIRGNRLSRKNEITIKNHNSDHSNIKRYENFLLNLICNPLYKFIIYKYANIKR